MQQWIQKRILPFLLMTSILLGGIGWASAADPEKEHAEIAPGVEGDASGWDTALEEGEALTEEADAAPESVPGRASAGIGLCRDRHIAYLSGSGEVLPRFRPTEPLTRAEAAQVFFLLLDGQTPQTAADIAYSDVPENAWYAPAARAMGALGVMRAGEPTFEPAAVLTRAEWSRCLSCFFPLRTEGEGFSDVPENHPAAAAIRSARAYGWVTGGTDGCFRPDDPITRVEAAVMLNRALGREPDLAYIEHAHLAFYLDVSPESWYYGAVLEASVPHEAFRQGESEQWRSHIRPAPEPETGFAVAAGCVYYYDRSRGDVLRGETLETFRFDAQGRLTTGSSWLDRKALALVQERTGVPLDLPAFSALLAEAAQAGPGWNLILVNRDNPIPEGFTIPEFTTVSGGYRIDSRVAPALEAFLAGARAAGYQPQVCSAYRSHEKQTELFERRVRSLTSRGRSRADAEAAASFWVARPDTSEHQAGLAADIIDAAYPVLNRSQERRPVQQWLIEHCTEYGFILRYPTDKSDLTGVGYEPWHYRYVGVEAAREIRVRGICLEEYLS